MRARLACSLPLAVVLVGACSDDERTSSGGTSTIFSTELKTGIATYYAADGSGNCSFEKTPDDLDVVALNTPEYAESALCGACLHVRGPVGEVTVRVVDRCPECERGHLDLSKQAFAKIAELEKGRVDVSYQLVACDVEGHVSYHFKDGSSKYWTAIQVRNHRLPVAKLEYKRRGSYVEMRRMPYNYFVAEDGVGDLPQGLELRVTAADGQAFDEKLPGVVPDDEIVPGTRQFD